MLHKFFPACLLLALTAGVLLTAPPEAAAQINVRKAIKKQAAKATQGAVEGAGDAAAQKAEDAAAEKTADALDAAYPSGGGGAGSAEGGGAGVVDFRTLRAMLPERVGARARTEATGERSGALGIRTSQATGRYGKNSELELTIVDLGTLKSLSALGYAWLSAEVDREDDNGYERTTRYKDMPAYEKAQRGGAAEMQVLVGDRFAVSARSAEGGMDAVRAAVEAVDLDKLIALAPPAEALIADHAALKGMLPAAFAGLDLAGSQSEKTSALGITMATASGRYGGGDQILTLEITDMGSLSGLNALGYSWLGLQVDNESDEGYERTFKMGAYPAREMFTKGGAGAPDQAEVSVAVGQRFIVTARGEGVRPEAIKAALGKMDLERLSALR